MDDETQINRSKIRLGLAMVTFVIAVALVLFFVIDDALGKAIMFGVAAAAFIRAFLMAKALRSDDA